jgi:hypothetical protein
MYLCGRGAYKWCWCSRMTIYSINNYTINWCYQSWARYHWIIKYRLISRYRISPLIRKRCASVTIELSFDDCIGTILFFKSLIVRLDDPTCYKNIRSTGKRHRYPGDPHTILITCYRCSNRSICDNHTVRYRFSCYWCTCSLVVGGNVIECNASRFKQKRVTVC